MIEKLKTWDTETFLALNFDGGALLDAIMCYFSWMGSYFILIIFFLFLMKRNKGIDYKHIGIIVLFLGLIVLMASLTSGFFKHFETTGFLKDYVQKLRPCYNPNLEGLIHFPTDYTKERLYGTVSGHAANGFGIAMFLVLTYRKRWFTYFALSYVLIISYSRIYLGVHYPFDLIFGTMTGLLYGYFVHRLYCKYYLSKNC